MGVSNTANTLNFIKDMKDYIFAILLLISLLGISYFVATYDDVVKLNKNTSSPVEEMFHRQIVTTLDSILDARFGTGCCKEDIDTVNADTFRTRFGDILSPTN